MTQHVLRAKQQQLDPFGPHYASNKLPTQNKLSTVHNPLIHMDIKLTEHVGRMLNN